MSDSTELAEVSSILKAGDFCGLVCTAAGRDFFGLVILDQNGVCDCVILGMTQTDENRADAQTFCQFCCPAVQDDKRLAAGLPPYFNISPTKLTDKPCPERLRHRFLGGKSRRKMRRGILHRLAVFHLSQLVDLLDEVIAVASDGVRNSCVFHHINPDPKNHPQLFKQPNIWRTAYSRPTEIAREIIECPILNSFQCGIFLKSLTLS